MRQNIFSYFRLGLPIAAMTLLAALSAGPVLAQQPGAATMPALGTPVTTPAPMAAAPAAPVTATMPPPAVMTPPGSQAPAGSPPGMQAAAPAPAAMPAQPMAPTAAPEDTNPFSSVKPIDNQAMKQALPVLEQRMRSMEEKVSAIQQVQVALPADALGGPRMGGGPGAPMDPQAVELETATFVACVNGQALFRDSDQKPFFVNAKEANQNEAIRRIGGCKH